MNFALNEKKSKIMNSSQQQIVNGIIVNTNRLSIPRKKVKRIQALLYGLEFYELSKQMKRHLIGMIRYAFTVNPKKYVKYYDKFRELEPDFKS